MRRQFIKTGPNVLIKAIFSIAAFPQNLACASNKTVESSKNMTCADDVLPIASYPQFILNQYLEVGQKPAHTKQYFVPPSQPSTVKMVLLMHLREVSNFAG